MFKTELETKLRDGIWILTAPLIYESKLIGKVVVPDGFETDFASVPRVPVAYWLWGNRAHREAVIHDYLFRKDSSPVVTFSEANEVFFEAMTVTGKPWHVRYPMYWGVCLGAHSCFHKRKVGDSL